MIRSLLPLLLVSGSCVSTPEPVPPLASARLASDFESYSIERVGLLPAVGVRTTPEYATQLQSALFAEFSAATAYEIITLDEQDLEAIPSLDPYRKGGYSANTLVQIAKRYRVDALLIPTVTDLQSHPPQRLGLKVEMVSTETGQPIWSSAIQLDAAREDVRRGLEAWAMQHVGDVSQTTWELTLISPRRMARFAAFQIAALI